jgi:hypothetical protein
LKKIILNISVCVIYVPTSTYKREGILFILSFPFVGVEVLTAVVMKCSVFWDITPICYLKVTDVSEDHVIFIFRIEK